MHLPHMKPVLQGRKRCIPGHQLSIPAKPTSSHLVVPLEVRVSNDVARKLSQLEVGDERIRCRHLCGRGLHDLQGNANMCIPSATCVTLLPEILYFDGDRHFLFCGQQTHLHE